MQCQRIAGQLPCWSTGTQFTTAWALATGNEDNVCPLGVCRFRRHRIVVCCAVLSNNIINTEEEERKKKKKRNKLLFSFFLFLFLAGCQTQMSPQPAQPARQKRPRLLSQATTWTTQLKLSSLPNLLIRPHQVELTFPTSLRHLKPLRCCAQQRGCYGQLLSSWCVA